MAAYTNQTTWLVTGTSRGIGLEIVRQLLDSPKNLVIAGCRTPEKANALQALKDTAKGTLHIIQLDVSDVDSIRASVQEFERILDANGLDYLINNAGIAPKADAFTVDPETLLAAFRTNTLGPAILSEHEEDPAYFEHRGQQWIPHAGTIGGRYTAYAISKAGLNMLTTRQKFARPDFVIITLCPGPVKTDMNDEYGQIEAHESVSGLLKVITSAKAEDSGRFYRYDGSTIPW